MEELLLILNAFAEPNSVSNLFLLLLITKLSMAGKKDKFPMTDERALIALVTMFLHYSVIRLIWKTHYLSVPKFWLVKESLKA